MYDDTVITDTYPIDTSYVNGKSINDSTNQSVKTTFLGNYPIGNPNHNLVDDTYMNDNTSYLYMLHNNSNDNDIYTNIDNNISNSDNSIESI
jgi:hypothetical protein